MSGGKDRIEKLDYAERWYRDGLRAIDPPGALLTVEVDMSQTNLLRTGVRDGGGNFTYTHILVKVVASVLSRHPDLHRLTAGNRRLLPNSVDICLSIAGDHAVTPVLILKDAGNKSLEEIAREVPSRIAGARGEDEARLQTLRRWGWIVPSRLLRRMLIRALLNRTWYRRLASGTFQITVVPTVDLFVPFLFNTAAALSAGRVRDRVVAINGKVEIRPVLLLCCCIDHTVWNGLEAAKFLNAVKDELEQPPG